MEKKTLEFWTPLAATMLTLAALALPAAAQVRGQAERLTRDRRASFPNPTKVVDARPRLALHGGRPGTLGAVVFSVDPPRGGRLELDEVRVDRFDVGGVLQVEVPVVTIHVDVVYAQGARLVAGELVPVTAPLRIERARDARVVVSGRKLGSTFYGTSGGGRDRRSLLAGGGSLSLVDPRPGRSGRAWAPEEDEVAGEGPDGRSGKAQTIPQEAQDPPEVEGRPGNSLP